MANPTVNMTSPSGDATENVVLEDVERYLGSGWTITGATPSFTLLPPEGISGTYCNGDVGPDSKFYEAIDSTIDVRKTTTISDPAHYADVAQLLNGGWKIQ